MLLFSQDLTVSPTLISSNRVRCGTLDFLQVQFNAICPCRSWSQKQSLCLRLSYVLCAFLVSPMRVTNSAYRIFLYFTTVIRFDEFIIYVL
jgi:hypothetical protein